MLNHERMKNKKRIGVALSGGGYRAAAFHLGTLRKLDELKILDHVDVFSTVSGGSIVGADYVLHKKPNSIYKDFEKKHIDKLKQSIIKKVLTSFTALLLGFSILAFLYLLVWLQFTCYYWLTLVILTVAIVLLIKYQFQIFPVSKIIEGIYNRTFFQNRTLGDLPATPEITINSTNLQTGRPFSFDKFKMGDSSYDYPEDGKAPIKFKHKNFPIARSVMASSSVPGAFVPVPITREYFVNKDDFKRVQPVLVDGGVFDNQGIHKLSHEKSRFECDLLIISDAGNKIEKAGAFGNTILLLTRCLNLFMERIKKFQMTDNLYHNVVLKKKEIAYISLGWDLKNCISGFVNNLEDGLILPHLVKLHAIPQDLLEPFNKLKIIEYLEKSLGYHELEIQMDGKTKIARGVGTNLTALSDERINALINHAEIMTELQVRLYCPTLVRNSLDKS